MGIVKAYVLIETDVGKGHEVGAALKARGYDAHSIITGRYDVIATIKGKSAGAIDRIVTEQISPISGIIRTTTCLTLGV